jgi:hypothetical protein
MQTKEKWIQYRKKIEKKADGLLQKLLPDKNHWIEDVLIIGAGSFPSEKSLNKILTAEGVHFTLVEPDKNATDFFCAYYQKNNFSIENVDSQTFLRTTQKKFDLIYFEHPETMTLPLVLGQLGIKTLKRVASFRESFAYLANVLTEKSVIIASCMSKHECDQLNHLLRYSLHIPVKTFSSMKNFFYGGPYSSGLVGLTENNHAKLSCQHALSWHPVHHLLDASLKHAGMTDSFKQAKSIRRSTRALCMFLLLSIVCYIFYCSQFPGPDHALQRLLMIILIGAQLYLHRPGAPGFLIKIFLFALQIALYF